MRYAGDSDTGGPWTTLAETLVWSDPLHRCLVYALTLCPVPFELAVAAGCHGPEEVVWPERKRRWESCNSRAVFEGEIIAFNLWVVAK